MVENMIDETLKTNLVLLQELKGNPTHKIRKRVGRGPASGSGKTCGRGYNGQKSRSGYSKRLGFEGGQMPLIRRVPKRGFTNIFKKDFKVVNLNTLNLFDAGSIVNPSLLVEKKIVKGRNPLIKILGNDEINKPLNVEAHKFSKTAKEKIEAAGGTIKVIE